MKRILSLLLTVIFTLSLFPAAAYAAPDWPADVAIEADGGIVMDADSGAVLFGRGNVDSRSTAIPDSPKAAEPVVTDLPKPEPDPGEGNGYCPNCGAPLSVKDTYCGVCGRRLRWRS